MVEDSPRRARRPVEAGTHQGEGSRWMAAGNRLLAEVENLVAVGSRLEGGSHHPVEESHRLEGELQRGAG